MTKPAAANSLVLVRPDVIVLDIEGSLSSPWYAFETLYPYARERFAEYLDNRSYHPQVTSARRGTIERAGLPADAGTDEVVAVLEGWLDEGRTPVSLRELNGVIWQDAFASGELVPPFYEDAIPALRSWAERGIPLFVYSSGAVPAQRAWLQYSPEGNLLPMIKGHFDTKTAGSKKDVSSFRNITHDIAEALGKPRERFLFFSDRVAELDAARKAGWDTVGVCRPGSKFYDEGVGDHPEIQRLDQVRFVDRYSR